MIKTINEVLYDHETMEAESILLRKFRKSDAEDVLAYGSDEQTLQYLVWEGVSTLEGAKSAIADYYWAKPGIFAIELKETGQCVGCIELRLEPEHEKASFGYVLSRKYWGKGCMTQALSAVLWLCFEKLELNRVESTHFLGNEGSGKVMQKCGMELEGTGRQEVKIKGRFHDVAHYGITRKDWLARAAQRDHIKGN